MLTGFEVRAALTVNHTKDFNEDVETVPRRWLNNLINLVGGIVREKLQIHSMHIIVISSL